MKIRTKNGEKIYCINETEYDMIGLRGNERSGYQIVVESTTQNMDMGSMIDPICPIYLEEYQTKEAALKAIDQIYDGIREKKEIITLPKEDYGIKLIYADEYGIEVLRYNTIAEAQDVMNKDVSEICSEEGECTKHSLPDSADVTINRDGKEFHYYWMIIGY